MTGRPTPSPEDRCEIEDLYNTYLWALDTRDIELYVGTFWDDALLKETQLDGAVETWTGAASIRDFSAAHFGGYAGHQHRVSNLLYLPDPARGAEGWRLSSYWFTSHREADTGAVSFSSTGYSRDLVERRAGEWRFSLRWVERWPGTVVHPLRES